jgi:hypothetical protein
MKRQENPSAGIPGLDTLTFVEAMDKVQEPSETTNEGHEFVHFICYKPEFEANNGEP